MTVRAFADLAAKGLGLLVSEPVGREVARGAAHDVEPKPVHTRKWLAVGAERIGTAGCGPGADPWSVAFGGYLSCISLVDRAVPALRVWLQRSARLEIPAMTYRGEVDRWALPGEQPCCATTTFRDALAAADHWRSPQHVADTF